MVHRGFESYPWEHTISASPETRPPATAPQIDLALAEKPTIYTLYYININMFSLIISGRNQKMVEISSLIFFSDGNSQSGIVPDPGCPVNAWGKHCFLNNKEMFSKVNHQK